MYFKQIGCHIKIYILEKLLFGAMVFTWGVWTICISITWKHLRKANSQVPPPTNNGPNNPSFRKPFRWLYAHWSMKTIGFGEWNGGSCFSKNIFSCQKLKISSSLFVFNKNSQERQFRDGTVIKRCHQEHRFHLSFYFII